MLKKLLLFIILFGTGYLSAQTFYWVGGSGNWNDATHWSHMSGGATANKIPSANSDVVFDNESSAKNFTIQAVNSFGFKSISSQNTQFTIDVVGSENTDLSISGEVNLNEYFYFLLNGKINLNPQAAVKYQFSQNKFTNDIFLNASANVELGILSTTKSLSVTGNFLLKNSIVFASDLLITNAQIDLDHNLIQILNTIILNNTQVTTLSNQKSTIICKKDDLLPSTLNTFASARSLKVSKISPQACTVTLTSRTDPTCPGLCDGKAVFNLSGCTNAPYKIDWSNANPAVACQTLPPSQLAFVGATYSVNALCGCGTQYSVLFENTLGEQFAINLGIVDPPSTILTFSKTQPTCNAFCNGQLRIFVVSGVTPLTINWNPPVVTHSNVVTRDTLKNACAGTYTLNVTNANGCINTFTTILLEPTLLLANGSSNNITCNGACTGSATLSPTGGTAGYSYAWSPPTSITSTISNLCAGVVSGTVTDSKNCKSTYTTTITQPPAITLTVTKTNLICGSLCDGTASITASGGGGVPYTYTWSSGGSTTSSNNALCAGPYTVTVADNLNCTKIITFTLTAPVILTATSTQTNLSCNSACTGIIKLNASGGTPGPGYTYAWTPPAVSTASTATALCAGAYSYTVTDNVSCTYTNVVTITQPPAVTLTVTKTDVTCFGACNGTATGSVSGGTPGPGYTFTWSPGAPVPAGQGTGTITSLCPGSYSLIATDANGCFRTGSVTVNQPLVITPNTSSVSPTCGFCNGTINSAPSGGTGLYTYTLQPTIGPPIIGNPPFTGLCASLYTLSIKDAMSCTITQTINLTQPNPITFTLSATPINCFNQCTSTISTTITGGTPSYTVNWNVGGPGPSITGQCAGVHTATVTDANGCQAVKSITITAPTDMTVAISALQPNCNAQCTGIATATVTGGTSPYTYSWNTVPVQTTSVAINLCNGIYTATVTDSKGCTKTQTIAIITPPALTLTTTNGSVTCAGVCNGSVTVSPSGGTSPYTYSWNSVPTQTTPIAVNLCAGNYTASVTDSKGCSSSAIASVTQPPVLTVAISNVRPSCNNICIGAATASGAGGTGSYTYSWSPGGQSISNPTNLCVGVQTATVTDGNGCKSTQTVQINQSVNLVITTSSSTLACNGNCNGIATANPSGGTGPYQYTWTPAPIQNTQTATGLCSGSHTVLVADSTGCSNTSVVNFANPPAITLNVNQTNVSCNSLCNGSATATAAGGTGALTYSWLPGTFTTSAVSGLCAGAYTVTVKDANNCSQTKTFTITQSNSLTATFTSNNPSNCGLNDGAITFTPGGGTPGYTFTWNPAPSVNPKTGLGAGTYILNLKDTNGCSRSFTTTLSNPVGPTVTVTSNSISCFGSCTGTASLSITSATPSYTINWPAPISSTNAAVSGLCAGNYIATVTDANSCVTNQTLNIAQPTQITSTASVTNVSCNAACSGSINLTPSGGTGPGTYSYSWSPAGGSVEDPTNLCANTYSVNITDLNNCTVTNTYTVTQPAALTLSFNKKDVLCNGGCTGAVRAVVGGGVSPYTYTWTPVGSFPGSNLDTIINLCTGIYTVTARDSKGCTITNTVSIGTPAVLTSTITTTNVTCNAQCNGTATINPTGGTLPYTFSYNTTPPTLAQITTTLCAGSYTGIVTDANGCSSSNSFTITQPSPIVITTTVSNLKCNAVCNGSVATTVTGGNPGGYTYSWMPAGIPPVPNPTGLCAGNYILMVSDVRSCTNTAVVAIIQPAVLLANVTFTNPVCNGVCNGIVTSNPTGGTSPYTYLWAAPSNTNQTVSNLCVGNYTLIVTDSKSCQKTQTVTLTSPTAMSVTAVPAIATCGVSNGSIDLSGTIGGTPGYTYNWLNAILIPAQQTNTVVTGIPAGIYTVVVTDTKACSSTFQLFLSSAGGPTNVTITTTSVTCNGLCNGTATLSNPVGGTAPLVMSWANPLLPNPLSGLCAGPITAQVKDANGCLLFKNDTIVEPRVIVDNATITGALCFGICTGSITLNPSGGNGSYTYLWSTTATTGTITSLCPAVYTATITDGLGCKFSANYNLPSNTNITSNIVAADNICFNNCNGILYATNVIGGLQPYTYQWTDPLGQSTATATGLCNSTYSVVIRDANGCFNSIPGTITSPSAVTFTPAITAPSCGLCNGVAVINPVGGTPGYSYLWSVPATTNTATNLCAGVYVVQITDANGCKSNTNVIINSSSTITGEIISKANVSCAGVCDGTVTVTAVGGIAPITYHWVHNNSSSQSLTGLCPGSYFCNMTDASGCIRTASVVIGSVTTLTISSQVTQSSCSASTGSITVIVSGGSGTYTYTWLPLGTGSTPTVTALAPGSYTLNVSDGGCTKTQIFSVGTFSAPILNFTKKDIACSGICDGNIVLTISAATPTYSTLWSNTATTNSISALCAGAYSVIVTDANGCKAVQNFSLISASPIVFSTPNLKNVLCKNDCNGAITTIPTGGSLSYTYSWTPVAPSAPTTNSLCAGNYSVKVTDVNGCFASESYTIISPAALTLTAVVTDASCNTVPDGAVNITVAGGTPTYSYSWTPGGISQNLFNVFSGTYSLSVTDKNGCKKDSTIKIKATIVVKANAGNDSIFCLNGPFMLNGSNSIGGVTYQWLKLPLLTVISNSTITTVTPVVGTNTYVLVATNGACVNKDSIKITVNALPIVDAGPFVSIPELATTTIGGNPTSVTGVTYTWSPGLTLNNASIANPTTSTSVTTIYTVTVKDANGCLNSDTITVFVYPEIRIPNGFSPNGDGKNDVWQIDLIYQFPDSEVEVYNRWGERLFYSKGYSVPFNGQYKGKDLPVGTYYYIINLNTPSYPNAYTGPLTIFR